MFLSENISLSARLSLHLASTPPDLPQQSDRNHLQDALVLRLRTQFDHENTPTATAAQLTLPSTNHLNTFTRTNKVLQVTSTSENAPWCNMSTVQSLIELPKVARQNTHTLKAPSRQQFHCAKSPRDCKKTKHESALQPESPGRSSTERKRAMTWKTPKHESKKNDTDRNHLDAMVKPLRAANRPWKCARRTLMQHFHRAKTHWVAIKHKTPWYRGCVRLRCCEV